ncbi:MAG: bifunctional adenosylcobinamide kinase/adenosylcobinamide-phosphate guanylyltransferase [Angustibacter sp.]
MRVRLLGTGSADGWPNAFCDCASCLSEHRAGRLRVPTSAVVDDRLLLDCGPETPRAALRHGSGLRGIGHVLVTHDHPDHSAPMALLARSWAGRAEPVTIIGPATVIASWSSWAGPDDAVRWRVVLPGDLLRAGGYVVRVLAAAHGDVEAVVYDVTGPDDSRLLYATDTGPLPHETVEATAGADYDLVLLEATFGDRRGPGRPTGTDHLDLRSFADQVVRLRDIGAITARTQLSPVHLSHHSPPDLAERIAGWGGRVIDDGHEFDLRRGHPAAALGDVRESDPPSPVPARVNPPGTPFPGQLAGQFPGQPSGRPPRDVAGHVLSQPANDADGSRPRIATPARRSTDQVTVDGRAPSQVPLPRRTLLLGGARSGKSFAAEQMLAATGAVTYIATGTVPDGSDPEWTERIARHRARRPAHWRTVETTDVATALRAASGPILVDCISLWLTAVMTRCGAWRQSDGWRAAVAREVDALVQAWHTVQVPAVAVTNEVGSGVVPGTTSGRLFRDELGVLNTRLSLASERVLLVVAGRSLDLAAPGRSGTVRPAWTERPRATLVDLTEVTDTAR